MVRRSCLSVGFLVVAVLFSAAGAAAQHEHTGKVPEKLGTVHFSASCNAQAQPLFNRGVALLH